MSNTPMNLNSNTYAVSASTTSAAATLKNEDWPLPRVVVFNNSDQAAFVVSGDTSPTAVYPTSASVPVTGKVIAAGSTQTFYKQSGHKYIACILKSGTGEVIISCGTGE